MEFPSLFFVVKIRNLNEPKKQIKPKVVSTEKKVEMEAGFKVE